LDGRTIDEGAAFELGYCAAKDKKCFGLQTDNRRLLITGNNPMIEESLEKIFLNIKDLISWARSYSS
jgi:nucleoside 2-deoxyribosyltransferase